MHVFMLWVEVLVWDGAALVGGRCPFGVCLWVGAPLFLCMFVSRGVGM